jgi:hypothetical protein
MPTKNGVRRHERRRLRNNVATKPLSEFRKTSTLSLVEPQAPSCEPRLEDSILLTQERDDVGLLAMEPNRPRPRATTRTEAPPPSTPRLSIH